MLEPTVVEEVMMARKVSEQGKEQVSELIVRRTAFSSYA
jgi:hypothetical protein